MRILLCVRITSGFTRKTVNLHVELVSGDVIMRCRSVQMKDKKHSIDQ
jgi:hypothetical protein